ncbi:MAG: hypothetical protein M3174_01080 [Actinomycetota bacterium]|nr:hypothetical protein [Actinomycetota bacterium]
MFKQLIEVKTSDPDALVAQVTDYDLSSAIGLKDVAVYADRGRDNVYFIEAVFSSLEEAERNNGRDETDRWAARLRELVDEDPFYCNLVSVSDLVTTKGE